MPFFCFIILHIDNDNKITQKHLKKLCRREQIIWKIAPPDITSNSVSYYVCQNIFLMLNSKLALLFFFLSHKCFYFFILTCKSLHATDLTIRCHLKHISWCTWTHHRRCSLESSGVSGLSTSATLAQATQPRLIRLRLWLGLSPWFSSSHLEPSAGFLSCFSDVPCVWYSWCCLRIGRISGLRVMRTLCRSTDQQKVFNSWLMPGFLLVPSPLLSCPNKLDSTQLYL